MVVALDNNMLLLLFISKVLWNIDEGIVVEAADR